MLNRNSETPCKAKRKAEKYFKFQNSPLPTGHFRFHRILKSRQPVVSVEERMLAWRLGGRTPDHHIFPCFIWELGNFQMVLIYRGGSDHDSISSEKLAGIQCLEAPVPGFAPL